MTATEAAVREVQRLVVLLRWPACDAYDADRLGRLTQLYWLYSETRSEGVRQLLKDRGIQLPGEPNPNVRMHP